MSSFVARRLEVLSDIMFGVAMTVPVYSLPLPGPEARLTSWRPVLRPLLGPLVALGCSFLFTSIFWFSHHRRLRLTMAHHGANPALPVHHLRVSVSDRNLARVNGAVWARRVCPLGCDALQWSFSDHSLRERSSLVCVHSVAITATVAVGDRARYPGARLPGCRACQPMVPTVNGDVVVGDRPCSCC